MNPLSSVEPAASFRLKAPDKRPPFWRADCHFSSEALRTESSSAPVDTRYSHWDVTGAGPARPPQASPLDYAIAFEQYRLLIVSAWPETEDKQERLRSIHSALRRLELARANGEA